MEKETFQEVEIACIDWLKPRKNVVVTNPSWGIALKTGKYGRNALHECDVLSLSPGHYATEIEIKMSIQDVKKDLLKPHCHDHPLVARTYFCVPESLYDRVHHLIPERFGILTAKRKAYRDMLVIDVRRTAKLNKHKVKWDQDNRRKLMHLGCMRILNLKQKLLNKDSFTRNILKP